MSETEGSGLCITRRVGESFWVGEARITVIRRFTGGMALQIKAPESMPIRRDDMRKDRKLTDRTESD